MSSTQNKNLNFERKSRIYSEIPEDRVDFQNQKQKINKSKIKTFFSKIKVGLVALGSAVLSALAVFAVTNKKIKNLDEKNKQLSKIIDDFVKPEDFDIKLSEKIQDLSERSLDYDPMATVKVSSDCERIERDKTVIHMQEEKEQTNNRADAIKQDYPEFIPNQPYHYAFPETDEIKITEKYEDFTPQPTTLTTVSEAYAESLNWDDNKIARDLMQNFFDGHGQTLDGVMFDVTPLENGKHKVRISGKSVFPPSKAILLGESSKKDNSKAAGCYGEGLKMVVLKLLKEKGADNVNISSADWSVNWELKESSLASGKRVLAYNLEKNEPIEGNYIEFETDDNDFINSIINTFDRFYHYNNLAFKCPDFENDKIGIKILGEKEKGKLFIAGQEFEVNGKYEGLHGANIFIKDRVPSTYNGEFIFDPSRDRISLTDENIKKIGKWIAKKENLSDEDYVKILHSLQEYWETYPMFSDKRKGEVKQFLCGLLDNIYWERRGLKIDFPDDKYVADDLYVTDELKEQYYSAGYKICNSTLEFLGMTSIRELVEEAREHKPVIPNEAEKNKILILKDALKLFSNELTTGEKPLFTQQELDPNIYIFDRTSPSELKVYKDTSAEAIIDGNKSCGFWIDKEYLESDFASVLATALHELTHKFGGDESMEFSYRLTDVLDKVLTSATYNTNIITQLKLLECAWNEQK